MKGFNIESLVSLIRSTPAHLNRMISGITGNRLALHCNNGFWTLPIPYGDSRFNLCNYVLHEKNGIVLGIKTINGEDVIAYISHPEMDSFTTGWVHEIIYA